MKNLLYTLVVFACFCFAACKKHHDPQPDNPYGLPNATQSGKNTLGFLLNGKPWTPQGFNGTANLSIDFDKGVNNGIFGISTYRILSNDNRQYFGLSVSDSLNFISTPKTYQLGNNSLFGVYFSNNSCTFDYFDNAIIRNGILTLTKLDRTNRIVSGIFNATISKSGCETISITEGRFDMKY